MKKTYIAQFFLSLLCLNSYGFAQTQSTSPIPVGIEDQRTVFTLPKLRYSYRDLEPSIDAKTLDIHYSKHHKAYVDNLNKAIKGTKWENMTLEELFSQTSALPAVIKNNAGGHWAHSFYWRCMRPAREKQEIPEPLKQALTKQFNSVEQFKELFIQAGLSQFGSGWAWLVQLPDGSLAICNTPNQDNPLMNTAEVKGTPLFCCDVWEHAYYLKYQNRRDTYLDSFWNVVNWQFIAERYQAPQTNELVQ